MRSPPGKATRPTSDRVREALFSILGSMQDLRVVDGFAGTGALGLEALSRGAATCTFFEIHRKAREAIAENIDRVGVADRATLIPRAFDEAWPTLREPVDLIFLDPPYGSELAPAALAAIATTPELVAGDARIVWESSTDEEVLALPGWDLTKDRSYGTTRIAIYDRAIDP